MFLEILLVFLLEASLVATYESDDDDTYNNYIINDDDNALLELPRSRRAGGAGDNGTLSAEDAEAVRGAIQRLMGSLDIPEYVAPTSPTRSPPPALTTNATRTTVTRVLTQLKESASDAPASTVSMGATRSSYTQLLGQLIEYADKMGVTVNASVRISEASDHLPSPARATLAGPRAGTEPAGTELAQAAGTELADPEAALRARGRGRGGYKLTPAAPTPSTRNTLCTHNRAMCATMCFDSEKYRVSCPPTTPRSTPPYVNYPKLLVMLEELVMDYDTNITEQFRLRLIKQGYVSCPTTGTTSTPTTTTTEEPEAIYDYVESNRTGDVISKCFVCGLDDRAIPMNAHCSDAFAGEFLPMTPVDASARGHLAEYRKYCRFMDMAGWYINGTDSRTIWGRWTGGCTVRWVDLSGVYTQRTCRNRFRPTLGHHYVSKRMAKLEKALRRVDNGCIISPMASLVPFSRGVSLFARFHACVCTGNWCNGATRLGRCYWLVAFQMLLTISTYS